MSLRNFFKTFTDPKLLNGSVFTVKLKSQITKNVHNLVTSRVKSNIDSTLKLTSTLVLCALYRSGVKTVFTQVAKMFAQ